MVPLVLPKVVSFYAVTPEPIRLSTDYSECADVLEKERKLNFYFTKYFPLSLNKNNKVKNSILKKI